MKIKYKKQLMFSDVENDEFFVYYDFGGGKCLAQKVSPRYFNVIIEDEEFISSQHEISVGHDFEIEKIITDLQITFN